MKLSNKKRAAAYGAIHQTIVDVRISLKLTPERDAELAQVEHVLWRRLLNALDVVDAVRVSKDSWTARERAIIGGDPSL